MNIIYILYKNKQMIELKVGQVAILLDSYIHIVTLTFPVSEPYYVF